MTRAYIRLMRPKHWIKNIIIFLPLLVSGSYSLHHLTLLLVGLLAFSLMASSIYIMNDIKDVNYDRLHPTKKYRPLASGEIDASKAKRLAFILVILSLICLSLLEAPKALMIILLYLIINLLYTHYLKKVKYLDIIILTSFFMLRLYFGSILSSTVMTEWFSLTFLFAFISLVSGKRYMELEQTVQKATEGRGYELNDLLNLKIVSFLFAVTSMLFLNLYIILEKEFRDVFTLTLINLLGVYAILDYFDSKHIIDDDVVERLSKKRYLILFALFLLAFVIWMNVE